MPENTQNQEVTNIDPTEEQNQPVEADKVEGQDQESDEDPVDKLKGHFQKRIDKLTASNGDLKSENSELRDQLTATTKQLEDLKAGKITLKDLLNGEAKSDNEDSAKDQRIAELEAELRRNKDVTATRDAFREKGMNVPDGVIDMLVSDDPQQTLTNINTLESFINTIQEDIKRDFLKGSTPRTNGKSATTMTREQISKITDPVKRVEAIKQNMELFK
jgi:hypothetical protein